MDEKTMTEKTEWKFSKNTDAYGDNGNNYVIPRELTVTITLKEYRDLVKQAEETKISETNTRWLEERNKNEILRKENEGLKHALEAVNVKREESENEHNV